MGDVVGSPLRVTRRRTTSVGRGRVAIASSGKVTLPRKIAADRYGHGIRRLAAAVRL
jgi:hypothetical protein